MRDGRLELVAARCTTRACLLVDAARADRAAAAARRVRRRDGGEPARAAVLRVRARERRTCARNPVRRPSRRGRAADRVRVRLRVTDEVIRRCAAGALARVALGERRLRARGLAPARERTADRSALRGDAPPDRRARYWGRRQRGAIELVRAALHRGERHVVGAGGVDVGTAALREAVPALRGRRSCEHAMIAVPLRRYDENAARRQERDRGEAGDQSSIFARRLTCRSSVDAGSATQAETISHASPLPTTRSPMHRMFASL